MPAVSATWTVVPLQQPLHPTMHVDLLFAGYYSNGRVCSSMFSFIKMAF